ncbi:MAG: hypothetical protein KGL95_02080 [Patescibacteria group bacterium]|nr:hypothetical protein [Patescibacteria group bacterium]
MRPLFLALAIGSLLILSTGSSFAQTVGPPQQILGVYAQIEVQDSSGNLISYLETSRATVIDPGKFNQLINQNMDQFKSNIITVGGQNIEILKANDTIVHPSATIVSQNLISVKTSSGTETLVTADHDGYPVVKGDKVTTYWTIIRTAS